MKHWIMPCLLFFILPLAGCSQPTATHSISDSQGVMAQRQTLTLATGTPLTTLDTDKMTKFGRLNNTIEGLYQANRDGQAQLALARRVKIDAAKTTYTFTLWKNSHWSNGDLITAQNFVYAWRRALDPRTKAPDADLFRGIQNARQILTGRLPATELGVHAQGRFKLIVHLDHPMAELPQRLAYPLFGPQNQRIAKKFGQKYATKPEYQVYAGPFMVSRRGNTKKHWHMVPNPYYWDRQHVYLKRINVNVYRDQSQSWRDYQSGKLDEVRLLTKTNIKAYEHKTSYTARPYSRMILLNYRRDGTNLAINHLLSLTAARLAISHALDRKQLGKRTYGASTLPAQGIVPAGLSRGVRGTADFAASQPHQATLAYQPKTAQKKWRAALNQAGLTHVTLTLSYLDTTNHRSLARQLKSQLTQTLPGLTIRLKAQDWSNLTYSGRLKGDLNLTTQRAQYADPLAMLSQYTSTSMANVGLWHNAAYDKLIAQASNAPAFNARRWHTLLKADGILMQHQGVTPLFQPASTYLVNPRLNGVQFNTVGTQSNFKEAYFVK